MTAAVADAAPPRESNAVRNAVFKLESGDFPPQAVSWIKNPKIRWQGPIEVDLDDVDFANRTNWKAYQHDNKIDKFCRMIKAGDRKPVLLVKIPGQNKMIVVDGHHRALAHHKLGRSVRAFVGYVPARHGPWDKMHAMQRQSGTTPPKQIALARKQKGQQKPAQPRPAPTQAQLAAISGILAGGASGVAAVSAAILAILPWLNGAALLAAIELVERWPAARHEGTGPGSREAAEENQMRRAAFVVNAAQRLWKAARAEGARPAAVIEQLKDEAHYLSEHFQASEQRTRAGSLVDAAAQTYGSLLGWYTSPGVSHTAECDHANGHNFYAGKPPMIGYPGFVHSNCHCVPGKPFDGGPILLTRGIPWRVIELASPYDNDPGQFDPNLHPHGFHGHFEVTDGNMMSGGETAGQEAWEQAGLKNLMTWAQDKVADAIPGATAGVHVITTPRGTEFHKIKDSSGKFHWIGKAANGDILKTASRKELHAAAHQHELANKTPLTGVGEQKHGTPYLIKPIPKPEVPAPGTPTQQVTKPLHKVGDNVVAPNGKTGTVTSVTPYATVPGYNVNVQHSDGSKSAGSELAYSKTSLESSPKTPVLSAAEEKVIADAVVYLKQPFAKDNAVFIYQNPSGIWVVNIAPPPGDFHQGHYWMLEKSGVIHRYGNNDSFEGTFHTSDFGINPAAPKPVDPLADWEKELLGIASGPQPPAAELKNATYKAQEVQASFPNMKGGPVAYIKHDSFGSLVVSKIKPTTTANNEYWVVHPDGTWEHSPAGTTDIGGKPAATAEASKHSHIVKNEKLITQYAKGLITAEEFEQDTGYEAPHDLPPTTYISNAYSKLLAYQDDPSLADTSVWIKKLPLGSYLVTGAKPTANSNAIESWQIHPDGMIIHTPPLPDEASATHSFAIGDHVTDKITNEQGYVEGYNADQVFYKDDNGTTHTSPAEDVYKTFGTKATSLPASAAPMNLAKFWQKYYKLEESPISDYQKTHSNIAKKWDIISVWGSAKGKKRGTLYIEKSGKYTLNDHHGNAYYFGDSQDDALNELVKAHKPAAWQKAFEAAGGLSAAMGSSAPTTGAAGFVAAAKQVKAASGVSTDKIIASHEESVKTLQASPAWQKFITDVKANGITKESWFVRPSGGQWQVVHVNPKSDKTHFAHGQENFWVSKGGGVSGSGVGTGAGQVMQWKPGDSLASHSSVLEKELVAANKPHVEKAKYEAAQKAIKADSDLADAVSKIPGKNAHDYPGLLSDFKAKGVPSLTSTEINAVHAYQGSSYTTINTALRKQSEPGFDPEKIGTTTRNHIKNIDKAFKKYQLPNDVTVTRKINNADWLPNDSIVGQAVTEHGYSSCSFDDNVWSGSVKMWIRCPKGMNALHLNAIPGSKHPSEKELLLPRGTKFVIVEDKVINGVRVLIMEAIGPSINEIIQLSRILPPERLKYYEWDAKTWPLRVATPKELAIVARRLGK